MISPAAPSLWRPSRGIVRPPLRHALSNWGTKAGKWLRQAAKEWRRCNGGGGGCWQCGTKPASITVGVADIEVCDYLPPLDPGAPPEEGLYYDAQGTSPNGTFVLAADDPTVITCGFSHQQSGGRMKFSADDDWHDVDILVTAVFDGLLLFAGVTMVPSGVGGTYGTFFSDGDGSGATPASECGQVASDTDTDGPCDIGSSKFGAGGTVTAHA